MEAVLDLRLPDEQERVLLRLARYAADDGSRCFPGVAVLAVDSGRSERSVQRTLRALEGDGWIVPVANRYGGRGRTTEFILTISCTKKGDTRRIDETVKGDTDGTLSDEETVTRMTPISAERVTPVAERVTPVVVKGDTRVTPIDQEQIKGTDQSKTVMAKKTPLNALTDDAMTVLDDWRRKQGKTRAPTLNPVLTRELEDAVVDLGVDRLIAANTWAAGEGITSLIKAIRGARTRRKQEESGGVRTNGYHPPAVPPRNGTAAPKSSDLKRLLADDPTWGSRR